MRHTTSLALTVAAIAGLACAESATAPANLDVFADASALHRAAQPTTPPFDLDVRLSAPEQEGQYDGDHQDGSGFIAFRQPGDPAGIVFLDARVRDLAPNTSYQLQRAADPFDGQCTSTVWLTLGKLLTPLSIVTNAAGNGSALFSRDVHRLRGSSFDIRFRVIDQATGAVVLASDCYAYTVR